MTKRKTAKAEPKEVGVGPVCYAEGRVFIMPEDLSVHSQMTLEEIQQQPEAVWDEETQQWRRK